MWQLRSSTFCIITSHKNESSLLHTATRLSINSSRKLLHWILTVAIFCVWVMAKKNLKARHLTADLVASNPSLRIAKGFWVKLIDLLLPLAHKEPTVALVRLQSISTRCTYNQRGFIIGI